MKFLAIKSYWKHQHYHKRGAPWIKLHASVLADATFIQLPEVAQAQLMKLWSLASQLGHPLPNNPRLLAGKIGTTGKFHLARLIDAGFIVPCATEEEAARIARVKSDDENASISLAESSSPSREIEIEGEDQQLLRHPTGREAELEAGLAVMLVSDQDRNALTVVVARASDRVACLTAFRSMLTGNDPATPQPTPEVFGQALRDMATNGALPTAKLFRGYLTDAARPQRSPPSVAARTGSTSRRDTTRAPAGVPAPPSDPDIGIKWQT